MFKDFLRMFKSVFNVIKDGLVFWLDGKDFSNSPPTTVLEDRSSQFKVTYINEITDGNFSSGILNGTTGTWCNDTDNSSVSILNNTLIILGRASKYVSLWQYTNNVMTVGKKYYMCGKMKVTNEDCLKISLQVYNDSDLNITEVAVYNPLINVEYKVSGLVTIDEIIGKFQIVPASEYADNSIAYGKQTEIKEIMVIDLTALFGAGNEPSVEWCELCLPFTSNVGTADKNIVIYSNVATNGDFIGATGWLNNTSRSSVLFSNNIITVTNVNYPASEIWQYTTNIVSVGKKYYIYTKTKSNDSDCLYLNMQILNNNENFIAESYIAPTVNVEYLLSKVITVGDFTGTLQINLKVDYADATIGNGKSATFRKVMVVDLTELFGAGNEPTKEWCDMNLPFTASVGTTNKGNNALASGFSYDGKYHFEVEGNTLKNLIGTTGCFNNSDIQYLPPIGWNFEYENDYDLTVEDITPFGNRAIRLTKWGGTGRVQAMADAVNTDSSHKYFYGCYIRRDTEYNVKAVLTATDYDLSVEILNTKLSETYTRHSRIVTGLSVINVAILATNPASEGAIYIDGVYLYDLTAIYGDGNEPTDIVLLENQLPFVNGIKSIGEPNFLYQGVLKNEAINGNFGIDSNSNGFVDGFWYQNITNFSMKNNIQSFLPTTVDNRIRYEINDITTTRKYYVSCYVKSSNGVIKMGNEEGDNLPAFITTNGQWQFISNLQTNSNNLNTSIYISSQLTSAWVNIDIKQFLILDLTALFGAGYEPTQTWCDVNLPYFDGEKSSKLEILSRGKNLYNVTNVSEVYYCNGFISNNQLTITVDDGDSGDFLLADWVKLKAGISYTYSYKFDAMATTHTANVKWFTDINTQISNSSTYTPLVDTNVMLGFYVNGTGSIGDKVMYYDIQIELGMVATSYEPYTAEEEIIFLNDSLKKLPNGIMDTYSNGIATRNVGKTILDGSEGYAIVDNTTYSTDILRFRCSDFGCRINPLGINVMSDRFAGQELDTFSRNVEGVTNHDADFNFYIWINKSRLSTPDVAGFKTWLSANNTTVYYELTTSTTETIVTAPITKYVNRSFEVDCGVLSPIVNVLEIIKNGSDDNGGIVFDGVDDVINCGNSTVFDSPFITLECIINMPIIQTGDNKIFSKEIEFADDSFGLYFEHNNDILRLSINGDTYNCDATTRLLVSTDYHIAATVDGTNMKIYINGILDGTLAFVGSVATTTNNLLIGNTPTGYSGFKGTIKLARFYNRALNATEVLQNYNVSK